MRPHPISKLWSLPLLSVYLYIATILSQVGYHSYFRIPSDFIGASIKDNIIYFFGLLRLAFSVAGLMSWWMWLVFIVAALFIGALCFFNTSYRRWVTGAAIVIFGLMLWSSYNFGIWLASQKTEFFTLSSDCKTGSAIIPTFYEGRAVVVPIDEDTRSIRGQFYVEDASALPCMIESRRIGPIKN